jgi:hypothetical protein
VSSPSAALAMCLPLALPWRSLYIVADGVNPNPPFLATNASSPRDGSATPAAAPSGRGRACSAERAWALPREPIPPYAHEPGVERNAQLPASCSTRCRRTSTWRRCTSTRRRRSSRGGGGGRRLRLERRRGRRLWVADTGGHGSLLPVCPRLPCPASQDFLPAQGKGGFRAGLGAERLILHGSCPPPQTCAREPGGRPRGWLLPPFPLILRPSSQQVRLCRIMLVMLDQGCVSFKRL